MPVTTVLIPNPRLLATAYNFRSVTEYKDLPRKYECIPDEDNGIYGTASDFFCQEGCGNEEAFKYIVEAGDTIALQFRAPDTINGDPTHPIFGWREGDPTFLLGLEVLSLSGTVLWEGPTSEIADNWAVGADDRGPWQSVEINVDRLLEETDGVDCWYFRVKVMLGVSNFLSANDDHAYDGTPPVGWTYINVPGGTVLEWNGSEYVQIGPSEVGETWYDAADNLWYRWNGDGWVVLIEPPTPVEEEFDYLYTMTYRLRRCDEPVVRFRAVDSGLDCNGVNHETTPPQYVMDPIDGITFIDFFWSDGFENHLDVPEGTTAMNPISANAVRRTDTGWETLSPDPVDGDLFLIMQGGGVYGAGTVVVKGPWVPFVGWWSEGSALTTYFPGAVFDNATYEQWVFQHDFKVLGSCEIDQLPIERELTQNGRLVSRTSIARARVRTKGMPEGVALRVQAVLASKEFFINERQFSESDGLRKNNEEGAHWWPDFIVGDEECRSDTSCD